MAAPGMGLFAKLPVEIRLLIWEEFFPVGYKRGKTDLAILRTSKQLHAEILDYIHKTMAILVFSIRPDLDELDQEVDSATHLSFEIWSASGLLTSAGGAEDEELLATTPRWRFTSAQDALSRGFEYLPLNVLASAVFIEPPEPEDPGQLICLCLRIQQVVELLRSLKHPIRLLSIRSGDPEQWLQREEESEDDDDDDEEEEDDDEEQEEEEGQQKQRKVDFNLSLNDPELASLKFIDSDVDAAMFSFYRLDNVETTVFDMSIAKVLFPSSIMSFELLPAIVLDTSQVKLREVFFPHGFPADLAGCNDMFTFYLHSRLDAAEGYTARLLRLDRYAHWKEFKYDELFSRLLKKYPVQLEALDPLGFEGIKLRYIFAHTLRYYISRSQNLEDLPTDANLRDIAPNVPLQHWRSNFSLGLPPFDSYTDGYHGYDSDFWLQFESYGIDWMSKQVDLQTTQESSPDLSVPLDTFAKTSADAEKEWQRLFDEDLEVKLVDELGIRLSDFEL